MTERGGSSPVREALREIETRHTTALDRSSSGEVRVPGLTILYHPESRRVGERVALPELLSARSVRLSRLEPDFRPPGAGSGSPLADSHLSRTPIVLRQTSGGDLVVDRGSCPSRITIGPNLLDSPMEVRLDELESGVFLAFGTHVGLLLHWLDPVPGGPASLGLVGESTAIARLRREVERIARLDVPVLLRGETGTGKELVARALHEASPRRSASYVAVNMAAIPPTLAASELFGAHRGAFTGAERKKDGFFGRANGGSLFLDEIGETPAEVQALLLRALENHEIQPVGAVETRKVDVRVIAATDADLGTAVESGSFRAPLLHRLAGYEIRVPPLRRRRDDIPRLLIHFLRHELTTLGDEGRLQGSDWLPFEVVRRLMAFSWPGNVRQLKNVVRRLAILGGESTRRLLAEMEEVLGKTDGRTEPPEEIRPAVLGATSTEVAAGGEGGAHEPRRYRKPSEVGEEELLATLAEHRWRLQPAAAALGISRASLYLLIEACDHIRKASDLRREEIETARREAGADPAEMASYLEVSEQGLKRRMRALGMR